VNQYDRTMQALGEPPVNAIREHGLLAAADASVLATCESCRARGRLTVLRVGETRDCVQCRDLARRSRAEFCPCGGRLNTTGKCENGCRQEA
jgi:hypothetical protein